MTIELIVGWIIFCLCISSHQRHVKDYRGASQIYLFALNISVALGLISSLFIIVLLFISYTWYLPVILLIMGVLISEFLYIFIGKTIGNFGTLILEFIAFIGWPLCAIFIYYSI